MASSSKATNGVPERNIELMCVFLVRRPATYAL